MDKNARRFFLDIDEDGTVVLSAPKRTAFDGRHDFPDQQGSSNVGEGNVGFYGKINFADRLFTVKVESQPKGKS